MTRRRLPLVLLLTAGLAVRATVAAQTDPATADGAYRGYLAVRIVDDRPEVIEALHADRLFVPASVLKVLTVATALDHLGEEYRWRTRVVAIGEVVDGVLQGTLVVEPGADPTWGAEFFPGGSAAPLQALAAEIRDQGLTRVAGDLVVDTAGFPGRRHPVDRSFSDLSYRVATPPAALAVDEATVSVRVAPAAVEGQPAVVVAPPGLQIINHTTTVGRDRHGRGTLDFIPLWSTDTLLLRGEYPISEPTFVVAASDPAPELRAARRLRRALTEAGVIIDGDVRVDPRPVPGGDRIPMAELRSLPLAAVASRILTDSDNWYADMLTLTLAREVAGTGRFDDGVEVIVDFAADRLRDDDREGPALAIRDGSGLSATNLVSPEIVVAVVTHALTQPWGRTLVGALARPGAGTLGAWPAVPPLAAKTGTLRHTVALAGVIAPESDAPVVFCYFVNHYPEGRTAARREIAAMLFRWAASTAP